MRNRKMKTQQTHKTQQTKQKMKTMQLHKRYNRNRPQQIENKFIK